MLRDCGWRIGQDGERRLPKTGTFELGPWQMNRSSVGGKERKGQEAHLGQRSTPLGCQAELGLHELQQKLSCRVLPAFSEYPFSWTDLGVHVATLGLVTVV